MMDRFVGRMVVGMMATIAILVVLARLDVGERRFYDALVGTLLAFGLTVIAGLVFVAVLALIWTRAKARAEVIKASQAKETHHYHEKHTIDGRGTFHVAGGDPMMYPDLVRQLLAQQGMGAPQLPAGQTLGQAAGPAAAAPAPTAGALAELEDDWTPYGGMETDW